MTIDIKFSNKVKWGLMAFGKAWAQKIDTALDSVDPEQMTDLKTAQDKLAYAVQHCDPDSGMFRVSGDLRGYIEKLIRAAPDLMTLGMVVIAVDNALEKWIAKA